MRSGYYPFGICPAAAIGERAGLLANLGYDPDFKRLGDGLYEQRHRQQGGPQSVVGSQPYLAASRGAEPRHGLTRHDAVRVAGGFVSTH